MNAESVAGMAAIVTAGNLRIDVDARRVTVGDLECSLVYQEFEVLLYLASFPGRIHSQAEICRQLWGSDGKAESKRLSVVIARLRDKLEGLAPFAIETVRLRGYGLIDKTKEGNRNEIASSRHD